MNDRNNGVVNRAGEKVLGVIGLVFNILAIILFVYLITTLSNEQNKAEFERYMEEEVANDPTLAEVGDPQMIVDTIVTSFSVFSWVIVGLLVISSIFAILSLVNLGKNRSAKLAGAFFIIAGLFAFVLSPTSILFYIAAIMCFVRRPSAKDRDVLRDDEMHRRDDRKLQEDEERRLREEERRLRESEEARRADLNKRTDNTDTIHQEDLQKRTDSVDRREDPTDDDTPYRPL